VTDLVGKHVLVGITYLDTEENVIDQFQVHGHVVEVRADVIVLELPSGEPFGLPPDPSRFEPAAAGIYRLRATGEAVEDPDLLARWTVHGHPGDTGESPRSGFMPPT
jgi:hypothetical protein